jgi:hypothetical protein
MLAVVRLASSVPFLYQAYVPPFGAAVEVNVTFAPAQTVFPEVVRVGVAGGN